MSLSPLSNVICGTHDSSAQLHQLPRMQYPPPVHILFLLIIPLIPRLLLLLVNHKIRYYTLIRILEILRHHLRRRQVPNSLYDCIISVLFVFKIYAIHVYKYIPLNYVPSAFFFEGVADRKSVV